MMGVAHAVGIVDIGAETYLRLAVHHILGGTFLGQEIAAHLGIGIELALEIRPGVQVIREDEIDGAISIETELVVVTHHGNGCQVIDDRAIEHLVDAAAAETVQTYRRGVVEAHGAKLVIGNLVHTRLGNGYLYPLACCKLGLGGIMGHTKSTGDAGAQQQHHGSADYL